MIFFLFPLFIGTAFFAPWWVVVPFGIAIATLPYGAPVTVLGGIILDATYGAPLHFLFETQYLYTVMSIIVVLCIEILSDRVVD